MRPIRTEQSNFTYLGPVPRVADLPCQRQDAAVFAVYQPTDEERLAIAQGANIELGIATEPIPPVSVTLTDAAEKPDPDDLRCGDCNALYLRQRELGVCGHCGGQLRPQIPGDPRDLEA